MILADTSVWADHLRSSDPLMGKLLIDGEILMHPFVLGEISLGFLRNRVEILNRLRRLPETHVADAEEVLLLIERQKLAGSGVGYVDAHLLATALTTASCQLWTRDKRLGAAATRLGIATEPMN